MPQPLRAVDPERHEVTRKTVKRWRSDADKMKLGISNQSDSGARHLPVDEILKRTEREMQDELRPRYHVNPYFALFLILASVIGLIKLFISIL